MQESSIYDKLTDLAAIAEDKIKLFHITRNGVDSFRRVLGAKLNKKVYYDCVIELELAHAELSNIYDKLRGFCTKYRESFVGNMREYLDAYEKYLRSAVNVSERRLILQKLILDIKVNRIMSDYAKDIPSMIADIDRLYEGCRLKAVGVNNLVSQIKKALHGN